MSDLALLEEEAEGLVEHGPGKVLGGHLAPAPVTTTRTGLVQHTVLLGKIYNIFRKKYFRLTLNALCEQQSSRWVEGATPLTMSTRRE